MSRAPDVYRLHLAGLGIHLFPVGGHGLQIGFREVRFDVGGETNYAKTTKHTRGPIYASFHFSLLSLRPASHTP